jgi:hypothetical protein
VAPGTQRDRGLRGDTPTPAGSARPQPQSLAVCPTQEAALRSQRPIVRRPGRAVPVGPQTVGPGEAVASRGAGCRSTSLVAEPFVFLGHIATASGADARSQGAQGPGPDARSFRTACEKMRPPVILGPWRATTPSV